MWTWFDPRLDGTWQLSLLVLYSTLKDFLRTAPILFGGPNSTFHFICSLLKSRALNKARPESVIITSSRSSSSSSSSSSRSSSSNSVLIANGTRQAKNSRFSF